MLNSNLWDKHKKTKNKFKCFLILLKITKNYLKLHRENSIITYSAEVWPIRKRTLKSTGINF